MSFGSFLGSLSPAYGMASGDGLFGKAGIGAAISPFGSLLAHLFKGRNHDEGDPQDDDTAHSMAPNLGADKMTNPFPGNEAMDQNQKPKGIDILAHLLNTLGR